ncbi:MAG: hypothetical protein RR361_01420 [Anaerovorax sp.]
MAREKNVGGVQIGTSFLVLIFVVLALVAFSVLSLMSALSDHRLTEKNQAAVRDFYVADSVAEEKLAEIDGCIIKAAKMQGGESAFRAELERLLGKLYDGETGGVSYGVPMSKNLTLFVELEVLYGHESINENKNYRILRWQEENTGVYEIDDSLPIWKGDR